MKQKLSIEIEITENENSEMSNFLDNLEQISHK